jgi:hypothetical protein
VIQSMVADSIKAFDENGYEWVQIYSPLQITIQKVYNLLIFWTAVPFSFLTWNK